MAKENDDRLDGQHAIDGSPPDTGPKSLGEEMTFAGSMRDPGPHSLGDEKTLGGARSDAGPPLDDDMEIVDLASRYTIDRVLGQGGMGEVLLATDNRLKRKVAIKRVLGEMARSRTAMRRFLTEAQSIAALNHPNIVQVYDYGRDQAGPFLIMEYVDGSSLLDRCRAGALPLEEAVKLTCQLCDGLGMAHDAGIIHRDIKPANVLLTKTGTPKLTDFGLARQVMADHGKTLAGAVLGTLDFMSPEQRQDAALADGRSDLWSLAATLYQLVTGKSPKVIRLKEVPHTLQEVLSKALEDAKEDRYQSAREFREALRACLMVSEPVAEVVANLGAGECPQCHTKNDSNRKFCRECAGPLRVACMQCGVEIPIWEKVCGDCGAKQPELIAARQTEFDAQRAKAESLRDQYAFDESLHLAQTIATEKHSRLQHLKAWAENFIAATQEAKQREEEYAANHFTEARTHREACDYQSAIHALEAIPETMRTRDISSYLARLIAERDESQALLKTISERVQRKDLYGLLAQVNRAVELQGDRADLRKLQAQLRERQEKLIRRRDELIRQRDEGYAEAKELLGQGQAKQALARIQAVKTETLRPSDVELKGRLEKIAQKEAELYALVAQCNANNLVEPDSVVRMLTAASDYLTLNPQHGQAQDLRDQLLKKMVRVQAKLRSTNSIGMDFAVIPPGTFRMGERGHDHQVILTKPFYLGIYGVTQQQYEQVMGTNPSRFKPPNNPVENISWEDAVKFCEKLSAFPEEKALGRAYRLPTEAEWEYACRAGTTTGYSFGDDASSLKNYAWYEVNSGGSPHPVGQKKPNPWGLYDMHGNVREWCSDWYGDFPKGPVTDPVGSNGGSYRVFRGGCWGDVAASCRSAFRNARDPTSRSFSLGFRLALSPSGVTPEAGQGQGAEPAGGGTKGAPAEQRPQMP